MNMSKVITALKLSLGLNSITLPFKDNNGNPAPIENTIFEVIKSVTIPEFSQFAAWHRECTCDITSLNVISNIDHIYELPKILTITPVMSVIDVCMPYQNNRGTYGDIAPAYGINRSVQGVATSQAYMMLAGQMRAEPTFEYLGHNQIRLYGFPKTLVCFKVAAEHMSNGESIEDSYYDSFMELATLDMKVFLYNNLKYYDGIQSAFGEIKLRTDDFQGAEAQRDQLLDGWRDRFHLDLIDIVDFM